MNIKEQSPNELILNLFDKFSSYTDRFKDRIKIDSIFSEFNENSRKNFNNFIKLSQLRYKSVKIGNSLESLLIKQKPKYYQLSNNILNDNYFQSNVVDEEIQKLKKKINKNNIKEIIKIRKQIISKIKEFGKKDKKYRDKLQNIIQRKREDNQNKELNATVQSKIFRPIIKSIGEEINKNNLSENLKLSQKDILNNIMDEEAKQFNDNMDKYKKYIGNINTNNKDFPKEYFSFSKENMNLLSYKDIKNNNLDNSEKQKKEESKIDLKKLLKLTKRGKEASKLYKITINNINRTINNIKNNNSKRSKIFNSNKILKSNSNSDKKLNETSSSIITNLNLDNNNQLINKNLNSSIGYYKNTKNIVKNEAENVKYIGENFDKKWDNMELLFNHFYLPYLNQSHLKPNINNKKEENEENNILNLSNEKEQNNLFEEFNKVYEEKKKKWEIEDKKIQLEKNKEKNHLIKTQNFINEIQSLQRKPQLYIDSYSKRDGIVNKRIELFNQLLNRSFFNKKNLEKKLIDFNEKIEIHEAERKLYEKQLEEKILEKKKTKESILEKEIVEKLKQNLKNSKENTFEFNYEVVGQKVKKNNKDNAYKEYLDFFRNIINKDYNSQKNEKTIKIKKLQKSNSQENINSKVLHLKKLLKYKKNLKEENEESNNTKLIVIESLE